MALKYVVSPTFFETKSYKQEQELHEFIGGAFPDLYHQLKGLVKILLASICFNCGNFIEIITQGVFLYSSVCFVNLHRSIISIEVVRNPWYETERTPYFTGTPPHEIILSVIELIWYGKEAMKCGMVSNLID